MVVSSFANASAEEVETLLTRPVEDAVATVAGLLAMTSVSAEGVSSVQLRFAWGTNMSMAAAEVREKLDLIADEFPREAKLPIVIQYDPTDTPIVTLAFTGALPLTELYTFSKTVLKPDLETINGLATVRVSGGLVPEIHVLVDPSRLFAHSLDFRVVAQALEAANINFPGGSLIKETIELPVRTVGRFKSIEEISLVPLGPGGLGGAVQIKDVAEVVPSHADQTSFCRVNGQPAVLLGIIKEPTANTVEVSRRLMQKLEVLRERLPNRTLLDVVDDDAPFIERSLADLRNDILWGSLLAFLVLLLFLRNVYSSISIMLAIPVSVIATFGLMSFFGVTVNIMSIGGMALGVGMLLDCSIVVLESLDRWYIKTREMLGAAARALAEVGASVTSGTFTTLAVLVPILFMTGMAQRLFRDFAFTMASCLILSLLVSILLLPAILLLSRTYQTLQLARTTKTPTIESMYRKAVSFVLRHEAAVLATWIILVVGSVLAIYRAGFELLPNIDVGRFTMQVTLPPATNIETLDKALRLIETIIGGQEHVGSYVVEAGTEQSKGGLEASQETGRPNEARIRVKLRPDSTKAISVNTIIETLRKKTSDLTDVKLDFFMDQGPLARILGAKGSPEVLHIMGDDLQKLKECADKVTDALKGRPWVTDLYCDGDVWTQNMRVTVDRFKAASEGISVDNIAQAVRTAIEGKVVGKFISEDKELDIRVRLKTKDMTTTDDLNNLPIKGGQRAVSLLGGIAEILVGKGPREILRTDKRRTIVVHANVKGVAAGTGAKSVLDIAKEQTLGSGFEVRQGSAQFEVMESLGSLSTSICLAAMMVYAILVIQFESLLWPLVVFTAVPVSIIGPAIALTLTGTSVNVMVLIGAVVLIGIVVNMAILMVATINDLRLREKNLTNAIVEGSAIRLRPILMTTITTVFGALPLCIFSGPADQLNKPLALTVVGGLLASAAFKLLGLPVVYQIAAKWVHLECDSKPSRKVSVDDLNDST
jgi:HAE1 family hydrophobic/amphiphilic exporter-1